MHDNPDDETRHRIARQFIEAIPHANILGMQLESIGSAEAVITMPWDARLVGDPLSGVVHGGVISTLMDTCCGAAVMAHPTQPRATATLDLRIDYMRGAAPGQALRTEAVCYHVTRTVAFVRATTYDEDRTRPVATATGAFTLER